MRLLDEDELIQMGWRRLADDVLRWGTVWQLEKVEDGWNLFYKGEQVGTNVKGFEEAAAICDEVLKRKK